MMNIERYQRQLALPEISVAQQAALGELRIALIGAGGLGSASLPVLAAAGVGHISIFDDDVVSVSNLHRQTIYKDCEAGQSKAELAAAYARGLNPDIEVLGHAERLSAESDLSGFDLLLDGSDNFETKATLNRISIKEAIPLISASVNQWQGQIGVFAGYASDRPCYHCLFPELPSDARNCNEAGILGSSAGLTGVYQAHLALCYVLGVGDVVPGDVLTFDFKNFRMQKLYLQKDASCAHCKGGQEEWQPLQTQENKMVDLISMDDLKAHDHIIVDVRTDAELEADPIEGALHMEVSTVPQRHEELPKDKLLAFVCAGNVRSAQAAEYLQGLGYENVIVLDKFSL